MLQDVIIGYKGLEIKHKETADKEISDLLDKTILGTEGGLRYSVRNISKRMKLYGKSLSFIALYKKNKLAGTIGLCSRRTTSFGKEHNCTFLRYLAVRNTFQITKVPDHRRDKLINAEDSFKKQIFSIFSNPSLLTGTLGNLPVPQIVYACVEGENERSKNFVRQAGYEHIRSLRTVAFSRFTPRVHPCVTRLSPEEEPEMAELLAEHYRDYSFYHGQFSFIDNNYYVLKKEKKIVAGVAVFPTVFSILDFPGFQGFLLSRVLPYLPAFRKLFQPGEFRFLIMDSIFYSEGNDHLLPDLFESVCALQKHYSAITWIDDKSDIYRSFKTKGRMGVLNKILTTSPGFVYASFSNISQDEQMKFHKFPAYISGVDFA